MNNLEKVLIVANEAAPFYKRGGLGDVMGSLPNALKKIGLDVRVVVPYYKDIRDKYNFAKENEFEIEADFKKERVGVYSTLTGEMKVPIYFLENKKYLSFYKVRGRNRKIEQFVFFDLAVANFVRYLSEHHKWTPSLIHCNDWHTGLVPLLLRQKVKLEIPTLLTIHNLMYQGVGSLKVLDLLEMKDEETMGIKRGKPATEINILGEGIMYATCVSTVSPTYAKEIAETEHDHNPISPFLVRRSQENPGKAGQIVGILNGIDYNIWSPENDGLLFHKFDLHNWEEGKKNNKEDLLRSFGLQDKPTFCFVGRMASQKGLDVLINTINRISHLDVNVIILGSGDKRIEASVLQVAKKYPWVKVGTVYSEGIAHKIYAGSDFIIIPSRYEPCGLIQMIAMKYGTLPIASRTGGLHDSIAPGENGFLFEKGRSIKLKKAIEHALNVWKDKEQYKQMVEKAIKTDFSWDKSAVLYKKLYEEVLE